jgi:phospholipase C
MDLRCVADPPHGWTSSRLQVNGGANDGFVREHHDSLVDDGFPESSADEVMGYHDRSHIPFLYSLADQFVVCDQWFCSVLGPTWPNRMYMHSAQSNGRINNNFPEDLTVGFTWPTIYDRLNDAGIEWRSYYGDLSLLLLWPRLSQQANAIVPFVQFLDEARSGRLPPVCQIEPTYFGAAANDDHPPHDFARGQALLSTILHAIAEGPQWQRTLVIITYDEHGGFYDHVPPPQVEDERAADGFGQLGVRVPSLIVSPWARSGYVSSMLHEHSSIPAFLEWLFGLEPLTVRDAQANFFLDAIDVDRVRRNDPRPLPSLPVIDLDPDITPECIEFGSTAGGQELAQFADAASIPSELDRRRESPELLRTIYRELIRMGGARRVPSR